VLAYVKDRCLVHAVSFFYMVNGADTASSNHQFPSISQDCKNTNVSSVWYL
jgi:hypothetical protein